MSIEHLKVSTYIGNIPGPHLLVLGAVHGDEQCGSLAMAKLQVEFDSGALSFYRGRLTLVPVSNPFAAQKGSRFVHANLNRIIKHYSRPASTEEEYANTLARLIDTADYVLDIHSYAAGSEPFLFSDYDEPDHRSFALAQGLDNWVGGWPELYATEASSLSQGDTISYAHKVGKIGVLVECGHHADPQASAVAYRCLRRSLAYLKMAEPIEPGQQHPTIYRVEKVVVRSETGHFARPWQHLDPIGKDEVIVSGPRTVVSPFDGVIILPNNSAEPNHEWLYLGRRLS